MLDLKTVFIYSAAIDIFIAVATTVAWLRSSSQRDMKYWCLAAWLMIGGSSIMSVVDHLPPYIAGYFAGYLGGFIYIASTGYLMVGFKQLHDRRHRVLDAFLVAFLTVAGIFAIGKLSGGANDGIWLLYTGSGVNLLWISYVVWRGRPEERLPSRRIAAALLLAYAFCNFLVAPFALLDPVKIVDGLPVAQWLQASAIPLVLFYLSTYLVVLVLKLERATENQRMLAERDALTSVLNRRAFYEQLEMLGDASGTLAIMDLDYFKRINDTFGHGSGDEVLRRFAAHVASNIPANAIFGRLGGEEFGLCLPRVDVSTSVQLLENLRSGAERLKIHSISGEPIGLTISCGQTSFEAGKWQIDKTIADADSALYAAKKAGRNRVETYQPVLMLRVEADRLKSIAIPNEDEMQVRA